MHYSSLIQDLKPNQAITRLPIGDVDLSLVGTSPSAGKPITK